ncbi:hypothetical protein HerbRD11066_00800 [Herbidospora sp. RD11066]
MWITERMGRARTAYHMPLVIDFEGALDACALYAACEAVIRRHAVLSTAVDEDDGLPVMVPGQRPEVRLTKVTDLPSLVREETLRPFDVGNGPLARFVIAKLGPERHALVFVAHHLVFDGESKDILVRDLADFYNGESRPRLDMTYASFAEDERERVRDDLAEAKAYWASRLSGPVVTDRASAPVSSRGAAASVSGEGAVAPASDREAAGPASDRGAVGPVSDMGVVAPGSDMGVVAPGSDRAAAALVSDMGAVALGLGREAALVSVRGAAGPGSDRGAAGPVSDMGVVAPGPDRGAAALASGSGAAALVSGRGAAETLLPGLTATGLGASEGAVHTFRARMPDLPGISRFELFLASVHTLLHRYGNPAPTVAVDLSTRVPGVRDNIGLFVNELPVSVTVEGTVADVARTLHRDLREMYRFRHVPYARAVRGVRPRTALAQVSVSYRKRRPDPVFIGVQTTIDWAVFNHSVRSVLHLQAVDHPDGLYVIMQHGAGSDVARIAEDLLTIMNNPETPVDGTPQATGLDDAIREIWQEVLGIDEIGDDEDLFDLGGHSLTITQIIARMRKRLGVEVPLDVFFDTPTIAGVVEAIREAEPAVR